MDEEKYLHTLTTLRHELRAPLSVLTTASFRIKSRLIQLGLMDKDKIPPSLNAIFNDMDVVANRLGFIVETYTNPYDIQNKLISVNIMDEVILPVMSFANGYAEKRQKHISIDSTSLKKLPNVEAIPSSLSLAFYNVLDNAIKYSENNSTVKIYGTKSNGIISIVIESFSNIKILENEVESIFEEHYRGSHAAKNRVEGSGIGLYISKQILESFNGEINLTNLNNPTRFEIQLNSKE